MPEFDLLNALEEIERLVALTSSLEDDLIHCRMALSERLICPRCGAQVGDQAAF